jgi:hypothetical protein
VSPEDRQALAAQARAEQLWASFDASRKFAVRFGLFPAAELEAAIRDGHDARDLAAALMNIAQNGGTNA